LRCAMPALPLSLLPLGSILLPLASIVTVDVHAGEWYYNTARLP
jgi:hypothetical protein